MDAIINAKGSSVSILNENTQKTVSVNEDDKIAEVIIELGKSSLDIEDNSNANSINIGGSYTKNYLSDNDYEGLKNKPSIEGVELIKDKSFKDLGAVSLTNSEIEGLLNLQV